MIRIDVFSEPLRVVIRNRGYRRNWRVRNSEWRNSESNKSKDRAYYLLHPEKWAKRSPKKVRDKARVRFESTPIFPTYRSWGMMIQRCTNPNYLPSYLRYGGANPPIRVCERWLSFENFLADMGERPEGTTLSRFGDVGNYCKENCAWHTRAQQSVEARKKRMAAHAA